MAISETAQYYGVMEYTKVTLSNLYLRQIISGESPNQSRLVEADAKTGLGLTMVNNWAIYDGVGEEAKLVAHAQGIHTNAGNWYNSFVMVFHNERFKTSTLQIMGPTIEGEGDWAIVGGTGKFAMACGVVEREIHEKTADVEIQKLTINVYCPINFNVTKSKLWGSNEGLPRDLTTTPRRLQSVTITYVGVIDGFGYSYADRSGNTQTVGPWGTRYNNDKTETVKLGPTEFLTGLSGTLGPHHFGETCLTSIKLVTNLKTYGPWGVGTGTPFSVDVPKNHSIVGFHARTDRLINAIGVYTMEMVQW